MPNNQDMYLCPSPYTPDTSEVSLFCLQNNIFALENILQANDIHIETLDKILPFFASVNTQKTVIVLDNHYLFLSVKLYSATSCFLSCSYACWYKSSSSLSTSVSSPSLSLSACTLLSVAE